MQLIENIWESDSAKEWITSILQERFGFIFELEYCNFQLRITIKDQNEGYILFSKLEYSFMQSGSDLPCTYWNAREEGWVPVIGTSLPSPATDGLPKPLVEVKSNSALIHYDILGLTYWMLNRIEEIGRTDLDNHGRFPATSSHAFKHGYLERPIVDEWLDILGQVIKRVWPRIKLTEHKFKMLVSHDVDNPSLYAFKPWNTIARMMAGHLLKRHDIKATLQAPWLKLTSRNSIPAKDPYNTFNWLMEQSETHNLTSAFYFICGGEHSHDADYRPEDKRICKLMRQMHQRGHEIGLHPSYATYQNPPEIKKQADRLRKICQEEGISQGEFGGRMHYLRWEHPTTLQAWEDAGMTYDTTLGYADRPGFRCGTCFEYLGFNPITQKQLKIRIRPLVAMECSVIDDAYLGLGYTKEALSKFMQLKQNCKKVQGSFTLLWHNSHFLHAEDFEFYKQLITKPTKI